LNEIIINYYIENNFIEIFNLASYRK